MSEPTERPETTRQGDGQAPDETAVEVEATEAAERRARELGVDLASVEGTGSGGRVTAADVNAQRRADTTEGPVETLESDVSSRRAEPQTPSLDDIQRQYVVLKATLAGPKDGAVSLRFTNEDGVEERITRSTFPDHPTNFFAPEPFRARRSAGNEFVDRVPVKWILPDPQRLLPTSLPGTTQRCRRDECFPDQGVD